MVKAIFARPGRLLRPRHGDAVLRSASRSSWASRAPASRCRVSSSCPTPGRSCRTRRSAAALREHSTASTLPVFNLFLAAIAGALGLQPRERGRLLGRRQGRPARHRALRALPAHLEARARARAIAGSSRRGEIIIFVARLLPVVRTFIAFPAGRRADEPRRSSTSTRSSARCRGASRSATSGQRWASSSSTSTRRSSSFMHRFDAVIGVGIVSPRRTSSGRASRSTSSTSPRARVERPRPTDEPARAPSGRGVCGGARNGATLVVHGPEGRRRPGPRTTPATAKPRATSRASGGDRATGARGRSPRPRRRSRPARRASRPGAASTSRDLLTPADVADRLPARPRPARRVPVHARRPADDVPRPPLDDAHVRRLRHAGADERALQATCSQQGQTGLSTAFDFPTLMGYDSDSPALARRGRACAASRSTRCATWRCSSTASRSTRSRRR